MIKEFFKNLFYLLIPSFVITFLVLEILFRFVVQAADLPYTYFDPEFQILKYDASKKKDGVYTIGKLGHWPAKWHINNTGWNSPIDYQMKGRTKPLIAVVGDSFIEGFNVDVGKNVADDLREKLKKDYDVYSFGMSGANLSQYYHMSRYVGKVFSPQILIINFIYNDFEQLFADDCRTGMLCLEESAVGIREAPINPYVPSFFKRLARHSSFMRYLILNLGPDVIKWQRSKQAKHAKHNVVLDKNLEKVGRAKVAKAADYLFKKIEDENQGRRVVFVLDGPRREIYANRVETSWTLWMNQLAKEECRKYGIEFIDMTGPFMERYQKEHTPFDFPEDYHWNELGHQVVAETVLGYLNSTEKSSRSVTGPAFNK